MMSFGCPVFSTWMDSCIAPRVDNGGAYRSVCVKVQVKIELWSELQREFWYVVMSYDLWPMFAAAVWPGWGRDPVQPPSGLDGYDRSDCWHCLLIGWLQRFGL